MGRARRIYSGQVRAVILYAISDRRRAGDGDLTKWAANCFGAGVDWVQIREKDLDGRALLSLASQLRRASPKGRILVNERADIALAAGLDGVHLPSDSIGPSAARRLLGGAATVGVSCHSLDEARRAADGGADFVVFGPVFDTPSKPGYGPPQGLPALTGVCQAVEIPVLALGGVNGENAAACKAAGAGGIAGISLFSNHFESAKVIRELARL